MILILCIILVLLLCLWGFRRRVKHPYFIMDNVVYEVDGESIVCPSTKQVVSSGGDTFVMEGVKYRRMGNVIWRLTRDIQLDNLPTFQIVDGKCNIFINGEGYQVNDYDQFTMNEQTYQYLRFNRQAWLISGNDSFPIYF